MSNENLQTVDKPKATEAQSYNLQKPRIADETLSRAVVKPENIKSVDLKSVKDPIENGSGISDKAKVSSTGSIMKAFQSFLKKIETVINTNLETYSVETELDKRPNDEYSVSTTLAGVEDLKIISTPLTSVSFSEDYISTAAFLNSSRGTLQNGTIKPTDIVFKDVNLTSQVFAENSNLQEAENFGEWLDNWYGSSNEKALLKLVENSKNVGSSLKDLPVSRTNVTSTNTMLTSLDNAFGWNLGKNTEQLLESKSVSYETHLKNLELTVDTTDNNESWGDFFKKVFSKNTLKEIGSTFTDAAVEFGLSFIGSLIPSVTSNNAEDFKWESDFKKIQTSTLSSTEDSKWKSDFEKQQDPSKQFLNGQTLKTEDGDFETYREAYFINPKQTEPLSKTTVPDFISFLHGKGTKKIALNSSVEESKDKYNSLDQTVTTTSMALLSLLGIDFSGDPKSKATYSADKDVAKVLHDFVAKNPLLGQHQYTLRIGKPKSKVGNSISEDLYNEFIFRVKNIDFPTYQRTTANTSYGHSGMTLLTSLQATAKHEAVLNIICDRNFDVLEYLIRLTGLGICTTGELPTNEADLKKTTRVYNLSTVADSSYTDELGTATLRILNGRDLLKANNMMNRDTDYSKTEPTAINLGFDDDPRAPRSLVTYGKLPVFLLENFKFVNLDYPLNFDSTKIDSKLLEIKATVTWTKVSIKWEEAGDPFYGSPESESDDKANTQTT